MSSRVRFRRRDIWSIILPAALAAALLVCGALMLRSRRGGDSSRPSVSDPDRVVVSVDARTLTARELEAMAKRDIAQAAHPDKARARIMAARKWIIEQVFLKEALSRSMEITPEEESAAMRECGEYFAKMRPLTLEEHLNGRRPLDEDTVRRIRESMLVRKLLEEEVSRGISISADEIEKFMVERHVDRRKAVDELRKIKYAVGVRMYFRRLYPNVRVESREYPSLEMLEGVSP